MKASGRNIDVFIEGNFPDNRMVGGKYAIDSDSITIYTEEIKKQCKLIFSSLARFEDYLKIVFAHELGHAQDKELEKLINKRKNAKNSYEKDQLSLKIEQNAWDYAKSILPFMDDAFFNKIVDVSLEAYRNKISRTAS
ncbi:hypothetical protein [Pseudalkalibacillus caeni]|uniref:IrrE N-terminal-like domain-containing protein n=1 Tax=Exobacillus caeni TaxID=2574798 RepID=A0A5R9FAU6_9BACL|nr:hypothetical protein [Pseudalkalibacillus caeni]TLS39316.1 hypothetical protein FCL54_03155 [Pseudalkalibacillus caeni]